MKKVARTLLSGLLIFSVAFSFLMPLHADVEQEHEIHYDFLFLCEFDDYCIDTNTSLSYELIDGYRALRYEFNELYELFSDVDISFWLDNHVNRHQLESLMQQIEYHDQKIMYEIEQLQLHHFEATNFDAIDPLSAFCFPRCNNIVSRVVSSAPYSDPSRCWAFIEHVVYECSACSRNWGSGYRVLGPFHSWHTFGNCNTRCLDCGLSTGTQCNWVSTPNPCQERCSRCGDTRTLSCDWIFEGNTQRCRRCGRSFTVMRSEEDSE
ncbi:MAG: hypothetical protein FWE44_01875 [Defluviitaleaceae bacterium]|nr:hypothetical protein [Defluviitaleaceae bacterium]